MPQGGGGVKRCLENACFQCLVVFFQEVEIGIGVVLREAANLLVGTVDVLLAELLPAGCRVDHAERRIADIRLPSSNTIPSFSSGKT